MNRRLLLVLPMLIVVALVTPTVAADPGHDGDDHGGFVTDDPSGVEDPTAGFDGAGLASFEKFLGSQAPANRAERRARNISLVGSLELAPSNVGVHGDVAGYKNLAFVGKWRGACPGTGVDIIDISKPASPKKIADTLDYSQTSMEDMTAVRIGNRDVLGIGLQDCDATTPGGTDGFELYDITNPASPTLLSLVLTGEGVHELDIAKAPGGKTLALLAVPNLEAATATGPDFTDGVGDLLILDISDPEDPQQIGEWGVLGEPSLGVGFYLGVRQGADARTLLHSVRANANGTRAYLSYWDGGFITLDISDPTDPQFLGLTSYGPGEEGNAHSVVEARGGNLLITADEDFSPFEFVFTSSAFPGSRIAIEATFTPDIVELPGREMTGVVVDAGRACPPGTLGAPPGGDPIPPTVNGNIALIERGLCRFDNKVAYAQQHGATGVIVYNSAAGGEGLVLMGGDNPVAQGAASVIGTAITIPAVFVQRSTGLLLAGGTPPVTARAAAEFNGWGYLRFFDISDPTNPVQISEWLSPNTTNDAVATQGTWSVHNPEVRGNTAYVSWYSEGVFALDISQPAAPREVGHWAGAGIPAGAPPVNIWSVVPHGDLLLASDRNFGLYILKLKPSK